MRILSLSLFHKFVEVRACGRQFPPEVVFWWKLLSVLKIVIVLATTSQRYAVGKRKRAFVACRHSSETSGSIHYTMDIHSKLSQIPQLTTSQLNLLSSNAIHFTTNL